METIPIKYERRITALYQTGISSLNARCAAKQERGPSPLAAYRRAGHLGSGSGSRPAGCGGGGAPQDPLQLVGK